ncbi:mannose-6-phosphate isomerase [Paenibacillus sp. S3N08]|uniref:Phosphohexomutase n=2 Tax=Paenibacillus agricola TaxID=2716264 RepID=A0ABX0JGB7_9BACL|nr:mannose-6-phosphate isomerase [Paenibacillus agricola]
MQPQPSLHLSQRPLKLLSNRVWRTYHGGKMIEQWQGNEEPQDNSFPEEWIASVVQARNAGREHIIEGLSLVDIEGGTPVSLLELVSTAPVSFLGERHVQMFGSQLGVLVKALDSAERLTIQVHPDRQTAKALFQSAFGKTEAWYILGGREIDGEEPYILYGFKQGMTREKWEKLFWDQDIAGMIDSLNKLKVEPGQVFLVEGGMPHAIGSGCFLLEIQEPTDFTIRVERATPGGRVIPDFMCHQGIGFERMFDCFHYDAYSREEVAERFRLEPKLLHESKGFIERSLISYEDTRYFALSSIEITTSCVVGQQGSFSALVVATGGGNLVWDGGSMEVKQGDQIFLPAGVEELRCERTTGEKLQLLRCFPPQASLVTNHE